MATVRTVHFEYPASPGEVAALLQDPVYLRHRSEVAGEYNIEVRVDAKPDGVHVMAGREKDIDLPAAVKAVVGSSNRAVEQTVWRGAGDSWKAEYTIEVGGVPGKVTGKSELAPSPGGCRYTSTFEITVPIPLVGKRIESVVGDRLEEQLLQNAQRNAEALRRSENRGPHSYIAGLSNKVAKDG